LSHLGHDVYTVELLDDFLFTFLVIIHFLFLGSHGIFLILFVGTKKAKQPFHTQLKDVPNSNP